MKSVPEFRQKDHTETIGQDSRFPYQLTEELDITDTEIPDPYHERPQNGGQSRVVNQNV